MDGAEITESVSVLVTLDKHGVEYDCYSLNKNQFHVIDMLQGAPMEGQQRNMMVESARISRGAVKEMEALRADDYEVYIYIYIYIYIDVDHARGIRSSQEFL